MCLHARVTVLELACRVCFYCAEGTVNVTMTSVEDASAVSVHTDERHPLYLIHHPNQLIHATLAEKSVSNRRLAALEKEFALLALSHRLESLKPAKATVKSLQVDTFTDSQLPILAPQALSPAFIDTFYVPKSHRKARRARAAPTLLPPPPAVPIPVAHPSPAPPPVEHVGMFSALRAIVSAVTGIGAVPDPAPAPAPVPHKPHPSTVKPLRMSLQRRCEVGVPITTPTPTPRPAFPSFGESEGLGMESGYASSAVKNASITTSVVGKTIASEDVEPVMSEHIKELQVRVRYMCASAPLSSRLCCPHCHAFTGSPG